MGGCEDDPKRSLYLISQIADCVAAQLNSPLSAHFDPRARLTTGRSAGLFFSVLQRTAAPPDRYRGHLVGVYARPNEEDGNDGYVSWTILPQVYRRHARTDPHSSLLLPEELPVIKLFVCVHRERHRGARVAEILADRLHLPRALDHPRRETMAQRVRPVATPERALADLRDLITHVVAAVGFTPGSLGEVVGAAEHAMRPVP